MQKPFKFRYVNEIAGAFVILLIFLLTSGVVLSGRLRGWFKPVRIYEVVLPETGTNGIRQGSEVHILGNRAGSVQKVELRHKHETGMVHIKNVPPGDLELVAVLEVRSDFVIFVGKESKAILKHDLGGFGAPYIEITKGTTPAGPEVRELPLIPSVDVQDELTATVKEIRDEVVPAIKEVQKTTAAIGVLANTLSSPDKPFQESIAGAVEILDRVNEGKGVAGVLLNDEGAGKEVSVFLASLSEASQELTDSLSSLDRIMTDLEGGKGAAGALLRDDELGQDLQKTMAQLNSATEEINQSLQRIPATLRAADTAVAEYAKAAVIMQQALEEYELLALALQDHWLVRNSVKKEEASQAKEKQAASSSNTTASQPAPKPDSSSSDDRPSPRVGGRKIFRR